MVPIPEESDAYKLYSEYAKKGINADNISDARLGNLYHTSEREAYETVESKKTTTEQKVDAINRLGKLGVVTTSKTDEERAIQQRAKALNTGEVTEVTATGNSTKIEGIRIGDGKTIVRTSEGEFALGDMTFSAKDAEIVADLGADSLDMIEMLMSLEEEFGISVPDDVAQGLKTVEDIAKFIDSQKK